MKNIYFHGMRFYFYCSLFIVSLSLGLEKLLVTGSKGFPGGSAGKESACNAGDMGFIPVSGRCPGEGNGNPTSVFLPGEPHGQRSLVGYSP